MKRVAAQVGARVQRAACSVLARAPCLRVQRAACLRARRAAAAPAASASEHPAPALTAPRPSDGAGGKELADDAADVPQPPISMAGIAASLAAKSSNRVSEGDEDEDWEDDGALKDNDDLLNGELDDELTRDKVKKASSQILIAQDKRKLKKKSARTEA